jgi:sulfate adenylyltransferase subunit 1
LLISQISSQINNQKLDLSSLSGEENERRGKMDILKIATAGSVDDGKSTLIGRLLYDTRSVTKDKLEAIEASSQRKGLDFVDLSLLTDGLIAEREQGITIDVAHIYFSTPTRKYIIADSPGHIEYTRNMITGASNAEVFIVLIDARNGVIEQTRRHLFIASLLKIETVFVCINKMDLVNYDQQVFNTIRAEVEQLSSKIGFNGKTVFIPISAKYGVNVVETSNIVDWYNGKPLLSYLEEMPVHQKDLSLPLRLPVQLVIRPHSDEHHDFRGYAGKIFSGKIEQGQTVTVLPSMQTATVKSVWHAQQETGSAIAGQSVTVELNEDVDLSRGNMIVASDQPFVQSSSIAASICWLNEQPLMMNKTYLLQHGINTVKAKFTSIENKIDLSAMEVMQDVAEIKLNDIAKVSLKTASPVFADTYQSNPKNGSFILIDTATNNTVAVGFVSQL